MSDKPQFSYNFPMISYDFPMIFLHGHFLFPYPTQPSLVKCGTQPLPCPAPCPRLAYSRLGSGVHTLVKFAQIMLKGLPLNGCI